MIDMTGKLEPEAKEAKTHEEAAMTSIAVSLKRIADKLDGGHGHELDDVMYSAGRAFENGRNCVR